MTSLTIQISDETAKNLSAEAILRHLTVEEIASERLAVERDSGRRLPTPPRPPKFLRDPEAILGAFADRPDLIDSVLAVVEDRPRRFSGKE